MGKMSTYLRLVLALEKLSYAEWYIKSLDNFEFKKDGIYDKYKRTKINEESAWVEFHFETNLCFGTARNREEWNELRRIYIEEHNMKEEDFDLSKFRIATYSGTLRRLRLNFGQRGEHDGEYTLRDFSDELNLNL